MKKGLPTVSLPPAQTTGKMSLEEAMAGRRSRREFKSEGLSREILSQLLWSLQGSSHPCGYRTTPSAGACYPLEIYVALEEGLFHYEPEKNELTGRNENDLRSDLCRASLGQESVAQAPAVFIIAAVYERVAARYGAARGERYTLLECGHAAQNLCLQAVSLGLGTVLIGAFKDADVGRVLDMPADQKVIYLVPAGYVR